MPPSLVTIAIPTWNRLPFLKENLETIIKEIALLPAGQVDVFISDNASDDGTGDYLQQLAKDHSFITYHRQSQNTGGNFNFYTVLKNSQGEYVWLLGDDDAIVAGALPKILSDIKIYNDPAIIIGGTENDVTHKRVYLRPIIKHELTNIDFLKRYDAIHLAGKMSVLIFKKSTLQPVLEPGWDIIARLKTPWPHLVWLMLLLANHESMLILPYSTNYIIDKNRFNLLQEGNQRLKLMFVDYAILLKAVLDKFPLDVRVFLLESVTARRASELLKLVAYSSHFNTYSKTLQSAFTDIAEIPGLKGKIRFLFFYGFPALLPNWVRKKLFKLPCSICPQWAEYSDFIDYLEKAEQLMKSAAKRNLFDLEQL